MWSHLRIVSVNMDDGAVVQFADIAAVLAGTEMTNL